MADEGPPPARDARVVGDLTDRERRAPGPAVRSFAGGSERTVSYRDCVTTAARAGNFLRHLGVRGGRTAGDGPDDRAARGNGEGNGADGDDDGDGDDGDGERSPRTVAVAPDPAPEPILTLLGAAAIGAVVRFGADATRARALLVHVDDEGRCDPPPGTRLAVYGGEPSRPGTAHWEAEVWSENPAVPPAGVEPDDPALATGAGRRYTHADLLSAARTAADRLGLGPGDAAALRAPLSDPRAVAAGVLAPLLVGGVVVLPDGGERRADVAVGRGPEPGAVPLADLPPPVGD